MLRKTVVWKTRAQGQSDRMHGIITRPRPSHLPLSRMTRCCQILKRNKLHYHYNNNNYYNNNKNNDLKNENTTFSPFQG